MCGLTQGFFDEAAYYAAKSAVVSYTRQFATIYEDQTLRYQGAWPEDRVKSYALCPWYVDTDIVRLCPILNTDEAFANNSSPIPGTGTVRHL